MIDGIEIVRHARARRAKLSVDPASGRTRLTIPKRASAKAALAWAAGQTDWLETQHGRLPEPRPFVDGATIPFGDETLTITWRPGASRIVRRTGDRLIVSGPPETIGRRIEAWLRRAALRLLSEDTAHYAARAGVAITKVAVGDARGRWGSCAASGTIRYNWRLALTPVAVRRDRGARSRAPPPHEPWPCISCAGRRAFR